MEERPLEEAAFLTGGVSPLEGGEVALFPVRHHSPACARGVEAFVRRWRPHALLVEGPRDAQHLVPLLVHPGTRTPVALYATFVEKEPRPGEPLVRRHAAWYPLADFSPELAAIRAAFEIGVGEEVRFVDLSLAERVGAGDEHGRPYSLQESKELLGTAVGRLCRATGMRDLDELWDHFFETAEDPPEPAGFSARALAFGAFVRAFSDPAELEASGNPQREGAMASEIGKCLARLRPKAGGARILVVAGAVHAAVLARGGWERIPSRPPTPPPGESAVSLIRFGFEPLDRIEGYAAGMPSPRLQQLRWDRGELEPLAVDLGRALRREKLPGGSTAELVALLGHVQRLASLRGHRRPSRSDLRDAVTTVLTRGESQGDGPLVLALADRLLTGTRTGEVPGEAGAPPIVDDFRREAASLGLPLASGDRRRIELDLWTARNDRLKSRFLHRLRFLEVPYASWKGGPDLVGGERLEEARESWQVAWIPSTEPRLAECSLHGATVEEAAAARLAEDFAFPAAGPSGRAERGARLIGEAFRMGLHRSGTELLGLLGEIVAADSSLVSLVAAAETLVVLESIREPLEARGAPGLLERAGEAVRRAGELLPSAAAATEGEEGPIVAALGNLRLLARRFDAGSSDRTVRCGRLKQLAFGVSGNAVVAGAAAGWLRGEEGLGTEPLARELEGRLASLRRGGEEGAAFLEGLIALERNVLREEPRLLAVLNDWLASLGDERFLARLPGLRLAFASLSPRETDGIATAVVNMLLGVAEPAPPAAAAAEERRLAAAVEARLAAIYAAEKGEMS
jgi:hypothetical protein